MKKTFRRINEKLHSSLHFRLTLLITALSGLLILPFSAYFAYHEHAGMTSRLKKEGELLATLIASEIQSPLYAGAREETAWRASRLINSGSVNSVTVTDQLGNEVLYSIRPGSEISKNQILVTRDIFSDAQERSPAALLTDAPASPELIGKVELAIDTTSVSAMTNRLILISSILGIILWFAASKISIYFLTRITSTFSTLMDAVKKIESGKLEPCVSEDPLDDEAGRAISAINSLAQTLKSRNEENERLQEEIVKSLRLEIDEEKSRNMAKLIQTNRMTSLGLMVSSMAHEINNPNGAIRLASELLDRGWRDISPILREVAENEGEFKLCGVPYSTALTDIEKAVDAITRSSIRIEQVVKNLRSYSLGEREQEICHFSLNVVAENALAILRAHGKMERAEIISRLDQDLPLSEGSPSQTEQVVINLLMNGIQAMAANGGKTVTIVTEKDPLTDTPLLHVIDSGPGIPKEHLPHIFEPFFSTRVEQGGSGLGLYISEFIIKEQGGTLTLQNIDGGGCRATIRLPAA